MTVSKRPVIYFHLHLVSDSTGETLNAVAKAACAQFEMVHAIEHAYALVRTARQLERVLHEIETAPGVVMYTLINPVLRDRLESQCRELGMPCIAILDPVLASLRNYLGTHEHVDKPGIQHELGTEYFKRIEALTYTMAHDDGQNISDLDKAEVVLVGVSRTSKTPTSIYLANRGIKAANVPIVPGSRLPQELETLERPLIVGLTVSPERLVQIRRNRLLSLNESAETDYVDLETVRAEMRSARRVFEIHGWPVIDVTRRSIEETAAAILNLYHRHADL
jgi:hypothetical protein